MKNNHTRINRMDIKLPLRIFAVDPATTISGWALLELTSISPLSITVLEHDQIAGKSLLKHKKDMLKIFRKQFCVLDALEDEYTRLLEKFKPDVVVSEGAFAYVHVSAALALTLAIHTLRRVARKVLNKETIEVPPTVSKLSFTGHGGADKDKMREAYDGATFLVKEYADDKISEHEIDAVSHGVGYIRVHVVGDVIQISAQEKKRAKRERQKERQRKLEEKQKINTR